MALNYLTREIYDTNAAANTGGHWENADKRWEYHEAAIKYVKALSPSWPDKVLEMGTMGASIVRGSDTIDHADHWLFKNFSPTYKHDARETPWPIGDRHYEVFVALRVWQHLVPMQREAFLEARRIADTVVLIAPEDYPMNVVGARPAGGVALKDLVAWNSGYPPAQVADLGWAGLLTVWKG